MTEQTEGFREWCIVEVMGHQMFAGLVSEQEIGGSNFIRLDVPAVDEDHPAFTKFFNHNAIYALTPTSEELARRAVAGMRKEPIERYKLPPLLAGETVEDGDGRQSDDELREEDIPF